VTYVPYILAELPSNLILHRVGPQILLPTICVLWGLVTTLQSQVSTYGGLLACRFFLGLVEGGLFPGIVLYLSGMSVVPGCMPRQCPNPLLQGFIDATNYKCALGSSSQPLP
jgi:hypothetical protein